MPTCKQCNDTGIIETGNNDIPCRCPAGDTAIFNVAQEGQLTGKQLKDRNALPQPPTKEGDRGEHGTKYFWHESPGCWHSDSDRSVFVVPPKPPFYGPWQVGTLVPRDIHKIQGHEAEARAFAIASGLIGQKVA